MAHVEAAAAKQAHEVVRLATTVIVVTAVAMYPLEKWADVAVMEATREKTALAVGLAMPMRSDIQGRLNFHQRALAATSAAESQGQPPAKGEATTTR
eukprot:4857528-Pleurochrysis_carterae.AAC.2